MKITKYKISDTKELAQLFTETVHKINIKDYTKEQIESWASSNIHYDKWQERFKKTKPYIVKKNNHIVGFFEFGNNGYIDCFYTHYKFQRQGIGSFMIKEIIKIAKEQKLDKIFAEVSITAIDFFEKRGFVATSKNSITKGKEKLINYTMIRQINKS